MIFFPQAKINLGLNVIRKREDGYHEIESVMYPVPLCDIVEIVPSEQFLFVQSGRKVEGESKYNLCVRAYHLLKHQYSLPEVEIYLRKEIPMGAGLGGGSSDAAAVLLLLSRIFELQLSADELEDYAAQLGSDCPFFISASPKAVSERGELMEAIDLSLKGYWLKLIHPGIHVSTREAYQQIVPAAKQTKCSEIIKLPLTQWKDLLLNDFEKGIFQQYPAIAQLKKDLYAQGAIYASMSGSGSAVYGIFSDEPELLASEDKFFVRKMQL